MNYIVFDLEATCWEGKAPAKNETIEIGALLIRDRKIISEFQRFIKPLKHPILSDFCKELTSIRQEDVDKAKLFYEVIQEFKSWIQYEGDAYTLCSWGYYDRKQFTSDCQLCDLDTDWLSAHISIKHEYQKIKNFKRAIGMKGALALENIPLDGTHHRGIDDARNINKIFLKYYNDLTAITP